MMDFYVYIFLDPTKKGSFRYDEIKFEYEPFYVGKGKGNRIKKYNRKTSNQFFSEKIKYLESSGLTPIGIKVYDNLSEEKSYELERNTIKKIGRKNLGLGPLLNLTNGGQGFKGCNSYRGGFNGKHTDLTREKLKKINEGKSYEDKVGREKARNWIEKARNSNIGKHKQSDEQIERIKNLWLGKKIPEDIKKKMSEGRKGISPYNKGKKVYMFTLEGTFIDEILLYEVKNKMNIPASNIIKCCKGERKSAGGFIWKYNK